MSKVQVNISGVSEDDMAENTSGTSLHNTKLESDVAAFNEPIEKLKVKVANPKLTRGQNCSFNLKHKKAADYFRVTTYLVRRALEVLKTDGIFGQLVSWTGRKVDKSVADKVYCFLLWQKCTWIVPEMSDSVSIRKNVYKQKRLILSTLNELYAEFRQYVPRTKFVFPNFALFILSDLWELDDLGRTQFVSAQFTKMLFYQ